MTLQDVTTPDGAVLRVPHGWRQGRGAYGGLTIAAAIRAIEARVGDPARTIRTVTAEIPGPTLAGDADVTSEILRSGSNLTVARAALAQGGETKTHAVAILAAARDVELAFCDIAPPPAPAWNSIEPIAMADGGPWPEFARHFEYRLVEGMPFAGGESTTTVGYVRARDPGPARDAAYLGAMIDVWWPSLFARMRGPRPMATIAFTLEIVSDLAGVDPSVPLLYRAVTPYVRDGYFAEERELWTPDGGRLLARNHQTFAIIQ